VEQVNLILAGGTLVTMNKQYDVIKDGAIAILDGKIVAVDATETVLGNYRAAEVIRCDGQIIMPGLINAHTHVPMTLLRGLADDLRLDVWLMGYMMPVEREFVSPEFCQLGTRLACAEMIRSGVTAFADMYYYEGDVAQATADAGMRALLCESILKFPSPDAATYEDSLTYTREFIEKWRDHELITATIAPHAPYSNTTEILEKCTRLAQEFELPLMIHLSETKREVEDNIEEYGMRVLPYVEQVGVLDVPVIAAHCVHVDEQEIHILQRHDVSVAHCPSANLKLASGVAPIADMLRLGVNVAIGTDGPASNNDLDMFEEMRLAALLAKVHGYDPTAVPARAALTMATRNGAQALGLGDVTGSLEVGKYADVIVVDAKPLHNSPQFDISTQNIYSRLVYAGKSTDVAHTIVHGRFLMRDRQLLTIDEESVKQAAAEYAEQIGAFLSVREENTLSKLVAVGIDVERAESFEIQTKAVIKFSDAIEELLSDENVEVLRAVHYRQYDTYFLFNDPEQSRVRYREDDRIDAEGNVSSVRMRLTYTSGEKERAFHDAVLLSHSRFIAPASHPLRFYQEYFKAAEERSLQKDRRRWHIHYKGTLFYVNLDRLTQPNIPDMFIEIKARTWSLRDAEHKAEMIREMMNILDIKRENVLHDDYLDMQSV